MTTRDARLDMVNVVDKHGRNDGQPGHPIELLARLRDIKKELS